MKGTAELNSVVSGYWYQYIDKNNFNYGSENVLDRVNNSTLQQHCLEATDRSWQVHNSVLIEIMLYTNNQFVHVLFKETYAIE